MNSEAKEDIGNEKPKNLLNKFFRYFDNKWLNIFLVAISFSSITYFLNHSQLIPYIILIFVLIVLIDYKKIDKIETNISFLNSLLGVFLMIMSFFLDSLIGIIGVNTNPGYGSADLIPLLVGIVIFFYGIPNIKKFLVPLIPAIAFFIVALITSLFTEQIHGSFQYVSVVIPVKLLNLFGFTANYQGNMITLISSRYGIDRVIVTRGCSGFSSVILYSIIGGSLLLTINEKLWKKIVVILIGALGAFFMNILRITFIYLAFFWEGIGMLESFHSHAGDILFIGWVGFYWWISFRYILKDRSIKNQFIKNTSEGSN